jgi:hypothetical protein
MEAAFRQDVSGRKGAPFRASIEEEEEDFLDLESSFNVSRTKAKLLATCGWNGRSILSFPDAVLKRLKCSGSVAAAAGSA